jgi:hypothetical protein
MTRTFVATVAGLILGLPFLRAQDGQVAADNLPTPESAPEVLYESPKGNYRIEATEQGTSVWVVPAKDPTQRKALPKLRNGDDSPYYRGHFRGSPDEVRGKKHRG